MIEGLSVTSVFQPFPMLEGHRAQAWLHRPAYRRPRHFHAEPELNFVFRGRAVMSVGDLTLEMEAGDVLLLRPGQDHVLERASSDLELVVVALRPELAERCLSGPFSTQSRPFSLLPDELESVRKELLSLDAPNAPETHERIITELFRSSERRVLQGHALVRRTYQALLQDPAQPAEDLARTLRVGPSELGRYFHRDLGLRFVEFRARLRLMRFIQRVDAGANLTEAALSTFGSYSQCHRTFDRYLDCSPSVYFAGARARVNERFERPLLGLD